jgi:hypothetical protein
VPAEDGVISEHQGMVGAFVGNTQPWHARIRSELSFEDTRGYSPPPVESHNLGPSGGRQWFDLWTPTRLGDSLVGWYTNQHLLDVGEGRLEEWPDASGNGGPTATAPSATLRPSVVLDGGGRLVARFEAVGASHQRLDLALVLPAPFTIGLAVRLFNVVPPNQNLLWSTQELFEANAGGSPRWEIAGSFGSIPGPTPIDTERHAFVAYWSPDADSYLRMDGAVEAQAQFLLPGEIAGTLEIGHSARMELRELFIVDRELTAAELADADAYLAGVAI